MKNLLLVTIYLFLSNVLCSQSLIEDLGGVNTEFEIYTISGAMDIENQAIIKKSFYRNTSGFETNQVDESLFFEIFTKDRIDAVPKQGNKVPSNFYFSILDEDLNVIYSNVYSEHAVKVYNSNNEMIVYSFNLINIPMVVLDVAKRIHIEKVY